MKRFKYIRLLCKVPEAAGWGDVWRGLDHVNVYLEGLLPPETRHLPALVSKHHEYYEY